MDEVGASVQFCRWLSRRINTGLAAYMQGSAPAQKLSEARRLLPEVLEGIGHDVVRDMGYEPDPAAWKITLRIDGGGFVEVHPRSAIDRLADLVGE